MQLTQLALFASSAAAFSFPDVSAVTSLLRRDKGGGGGCDAVWSRVSAELTTKFFDKSKGQCNDDARAAIRLSFHDCGSWDLTQGKTGGCDGSVALNAEEAGRPENNGLQQIGQDMVALAKKYGTSVADMIVFAGNHAIVTCPGGPVVKTFIGRKDSTTAAKPGGLPDVNAEASVLSALFTAKGFTDEDLAALLGAHSTSKQFHFDTNNVGSAQDSTPGIWDVKYYSDTLVKNPVGYEPFPSDTKLANFAGVGKEFHGFVNNQGKWTGKFADAMLKMNLFGNGGTTNGLADCTNFLPKSTSIKRELKALNPFMPRN